MFKELESELGGVEEQADRLGGVYTLESGVYDGIIKLAYIVNSARSKSKCVVTVIDYNGVEITERTWYLAGETGKPTYEKNGKTFMLPGYELINDLALCATGHPLTDQTVEDKTVKIWDATERKEIDKNVPVITSILGKPITAAILKVVENKQEKDASGTYVDTNEERISNETDKYFHTETRKTVVELKKQVDLPVDKLFISQWASKNAGEDRNRFKAVTAAGAAPAGGTGAPTSGGSTSLFG